MRWFYCEEIRPVFIDTFPEFKDEMGKCGCPDDTRYEMYEKTDKVPEVALRYCVGTGDGLVYLAPSQVKTLFSRLQKWRQRGEYNEQRA